MSPQLREMRERIRVLPDVEKLALVDDILADLDRPDPELDAVWADEVRKRRVAYRAGRAPSRSYAQVMERYRQP